MGVLESPEIYTRRKWKAHNLILNNSQSETCYGNHGEASTDSQSPANFLNFFLDSAAETATAPTRCKVGGEHKSTHPVGRSKQSFF
jgi:hypothetical protein